MSLKMLYEKKSSTKPLLVSFGKKYNFMTVLMVLGAILGSGTVVASVLLGVSSVVTVGNHEFESTVPATLNAYPGDYHEWNYSYTNKANQDKNFTLVFNASRDGGTFETGDLKLRIMDVSKNVLAESSTVTDGVIVIRDLDRTLISAGTFSGFISAEWSVAADNGTYTLYAGIESGSESFK